VGDLAQRRDGQALAVARIVATPRLGVPTGWRPVKVEPASMAVMMEMPPPCPLLAAQPRDGAASMVPPEAATLDWVQAAPKNKSKVHMVDNLFSACPYNMQRRSKGSVGARSDAPQHAAPASVRRTANEPIRLDQSVVVWGRSHASLPACFAKQSCLLWLQRWWPWASPMPRSTRSCSAVPWTFPPYSGPRWTRHARHSTSRIAPGRRRGSGRHGHAARSDLAQRRCLGPSCT